MNRTHEFFQRRDWCMTTMSLLNHLRAENPICKSTIRTHLDFMLANNIIVEVARHYYALADRQVQCRQAHLLKVEELLDTQGRCTRLQVIYSLGWSATFLRWVLDGNEGRLVIEESNGREYLRLAEEVVQQRATHSGPTAVTESIHQHLRVHHHLKDSVVNIAKKLGHTKMRLCRVHGR